jgi:hypothetical protein
MTNPNQLFFKIVLPLALPALAVTGFPAFNAGWTEFALSWMYLTNPKDFTLAMSLYNMTGQILQGYTVVGVRRHGAARGRPGIHRLPIPAEVDRWRPDHRQREVRSG